jgi:hypothetical protein
MKLLVLMEGPLIQNFRQLLGDQIDAIEFNGLSNSNFEDVISIFVKVSTVLDHKLLEKFPNLKFYLNTRDSVLALNIPNAEKSWCGKKSS